jgi:putative FmdB family regulatory protein
MPIFEYLCRKCGKKFEVFQRITDNPLKKCSFCEGRVTRVSSPPASPPLASGGVTLFETVYQKIYKSDAPKKEIKRQTRVTRAKENRRAKGGRKRA